MKYLITGCAGFFGFTLCQCLLQNGHDVVGLDNLNHYYDPALKKAHLERLTVYSQFQFLQLDIIERKKVIEVIMLGKFDRVIHLAAQAGVRYSLKDPFAYCR